MEKKKIGIITMHKIVNFGSALQAFALQSFLFRHGYDNEIIDYLFYPHKISVFGWLRTLLSGRYFKGLKFMRFWQRHYTLSPISYATKSSLTEDNCRYDVYLTGSDQVWNPMHHGDECTFMFDFIHKPSKKISYAASFSTGKLSEEQIFQYRRYLNQYSTLTVREQSGLELLKQIVGREGKMVCDPTFLLNAQEWSELANFSKLKIKRPYVLVYILTYAYDPYPQINKIIDKVQEELGMHIIILDSKLKQMFRKDTSFINTAGPYDFLYLIQNASFVLTTSFHGTVFAINFRKPFYSVIQSDLMKDSRMYSLLNQIGLSDRAIIYNKEFNFKMMDYNQEVEGKIAKLVHDSQDILLTSL